jgi:Arylsulfotransferase (ASST)
LWIAGGVLAASVVALALWLALDTGRSSRAAPPPPPPPPQPVQHFVSRPDLQPPKVTIRHRARGTSEGYVFIAPKRAAKQAGPMIIDERGQVVWFKPLPTSGVTDFKVQIYKGRPVLTWWQGTVSMRGVGLAGGYHILDTSYRLVKIVRSGHGLTGDIHEFRLLPGGIALMTIYRQLPADLSALGGPSDGFVLEGVVQELSIPTGRVLFEWHSLPAVALSESYLPVPENEGTSKDPWDYFHINSAEVDNDGNILISARHTSAIYKLSRRTHRIMWRLGGKKSNFTFGPGAHFAWQHDARRQPDGTITLFDNAAQQPKKGVQSRGLRLRVDLRTHRATVVRSYRHRPPLLSPSQGNMQVLADGHVFVGWGQNAYFTEYSPGGTMLFDGKFGGKDVDSYRAFRFRWDAHPVTKPDAVLRGRTVYVSWNGATQVVRWQVLAGSRVIATAARSGFETPIRVGAAAGGLLVRALDADAVVLATARVRR